MRARPSIQPSVFLWTSSAVTHHCWLNVFSVIVLSASARVRVRRRRQKYRARFRCFKSSMRRQGKKEISETSPASSLYMIFSKCGWADANDGSHERLQGDPWINSSSCRPLKDGMVNPFSNRSTFSRDKREIVWWTSPSNTRLLQSSGSLSERHLGMTFDRSTQDSGKSRCEST